MLLAVAEFTTLYTVRTTTGATVVKTVGGGAHHTYALIPVAVLAVFLSVRGLARSQPPCPARPRCAGRDRAVDRLLGDLPDAHASGLVGSSATHFAAANSRPSAGLYMETLGAVLLLITSVSGFLLLGAPQRRRGPTL